MSDTAGPRSDAAIDQLLQEADLDGDGQLRPALLQLRALGSETPDPSSEVAALLKRATEAASAVQPLAIPLAAEGPAPAGNDPAPVDELAARRRARRRAALTALSVAVSLGAGGAVAVAADQGFRDSFSQFNQAVTSFVTGTGSAPAPSPGQEPAAPAPVGPAVAPPSPAPAGQPVEIPPSDAPATHTPGGAAVDPEKPAEIPAPGLPASVPDVTDELGQQPQVPVPGPSDLPLPETLPPVPLR